MVYYCCVWRWKEEVVGRAHGLSEVVCKGPFVSAHTAFQIHLFCRLLRDPT
ncbi:hypothetical protein BDP81DRAFT_419270, partial [Colletotrichum phormii]